METNKESCGKTQRYHLRRHFLSIQRLQSRRRSLLALLSLLFLLLVSYNGASIFCLQLPLPQKPPPEATSFLPENFTGESRKLSTTTTTTSSNKLSSGVIFALKEQDPPSISKTHIHILQKTQNLVFPRAKSVVFIPRRRRKRKPLFKIPLFDSPLFKNVEAEMFSTRVKQFLASNSCKVRFFMTWISSLESFGERELFTVESLFKSHPDGCLIIVSNSLDSKRGTQILNPFLANGFRVIAISPDFDYLFKHTVAESWFNQLRKGRVDPGEVSLGQNLSNVLRLALLYKFGGVYIDTDVIILKSFAHLKNTIGAQTINLETGQWSRLNNAVMVFDKGHPLLYKFIEEFALTFNGNKWGHNGPYLVSRVVKRVRGRPGFEFRVLNPMAFYPVDWSRIGGYFRKPRNETRIKWLHKKLNLIQNQSYAVHLWNKQSRNIAIEEGSIIHHLKLGCCVFCNSLAQVVSNLKMLSSS